MPRPSIYDQHDKAFPNVSAFVVCAGCDRLATIAFKFPKDGAGRLWAYVHWKEADMVRGYAGGYGYDKKSAAVSAAVLRLQSAIDTTSRERLSAFIDALRDCGGERWDTKLQKAGFTVWQAV